MWIPENVLLLFLLYFLRSCFFPLFFSICLVLQEEGWAVKLSCSKFHWSVFVITYVDERLHKEKIFNTGQIKECSAEVLFLLPWFFFFPNFLCCSQIASELCWGDGYSDTANHGPGLHPELHSTLAGWCCWFGGDLCGEPLVLIVNLFCFTLGLLLLF